MRDHQNNKVIVHYACGEMLLIILQDSLLLTPFSLSFDRRTLRHRRFSDLSEFPVFC